MTKRYATHPKTWLGSAFFALGSILLATEVAQAQSAGSENGPAPLTDVLLICDDEQCGAGALEGQAEICPFLDAATVDSASFPEECPCDAQEITALQDQVNSQDGNFLLYGPGCQAVLKNVPQNVLIELAEVLAQGGELPPPGQIGTPPGGPSPQPGSAQ